MPPKKGRPVMGLTKKEIRLSLRLNHEEADLIDECAQRLETTRAAVVMKGVNLVKQELDSIKK